MTNATPNHDPAIAAQQSIPASPSTAPAAGQDSPNDAPSGRMLDWTPWIAALREVDAAPRSTGSLGLFVVTLVLFFSSGLVRSSWEDVVLLVAALLFHELGHIAAMKLLGYRDLRIFFVPFLGAAAAGRTTRHSSARACLVSLMGPLPGIVVGAVLWAAYLVTGEYLLFAGARILLFLNVFNLLPIMPLDGGRYVDVLFVKNRWIRLALALLGVAAFAAMALSGQDLLLLVITVFALVGAIANWKLQGLARRWSELGIAEATPAELLASEESAPKALESLRDAIPKLFTGQVAAQAIHQRIEAVLDTMRFRPARWWGKILLGAGYLGVLLVSIGLLATFLWTTPQERVRMAGTEGLVLEKHSGGRKLLEVPIDAENRYHGTRIRFYDDPARISSTMEYVAGYRHGRAIDFSPAGDTLRIAWYTHGDLDSILVFEQGIRRRILPAGQAWHQRALGWVVEASQPIHSNHENFQGD